MDEKVESPSADEIRTGVRKHYGRFAAESTPVEAGGCCGAEQSCGDPVDVSAALYPSKDLSSLPQEVTGLSAGCGDPVSLASLEPGQTVLDLGSGGGIDCFLAAQRVGDSGKVIGVDMTPEMIDRARTNKAGMGVSNVEFRLGEIEHLPVSDESVDVILSNCVINLSPDKVQVFHEAHRVLKPGGRLAVTDIVTDGPIPAALQESLSAWYGCLAGALDIRDYRAGLEAAGFVDIEIAPVEIDRVTVEKALAASGITPVEAEDGSIRKAYAMVEGELREIELGDSKPPFSARITARKPEA